MTLPKTLLLVCAFSFFAPSMVLAESPPAKDGTDPLSIYVQAGVTGDQQEKIRQMGTELEQANIVRAHELMNQVELMRHLSLQPELDEKKILATQNKINDLENTMVLERIKLNIKVRKLLSSEQKQKLVTLLKEKRSAPSTTP